MPPAEAALPAPSLDSSDAPRFARLSRLAWAILYRRVFDIDPLECSSCGGRMRFVEVIEDDVQDIEVMGGAGTIPARLYVPNGGSAPYPLIVYYHGGGFVLATVDTYDASARALASATGALVVSVEYRKAPENEFPAAHDDAYASYLWILDNAPSFDADAARVAVAGESAGGNLAASVVIRARDEGMPLPVHQLLVYPVASGDTSSDSVLAGLAAGLAALAPGLAMLAPAVAAPGLAGAPVVVRAVTPPPPRGLSRGQPRL